MNKSAVSFNVNICTGQVKEEQTLNSHINNRALEIPKKKNNGEPWSYGQLLWLLQKELEPFCVHHGHNTENGSKHICESKITSYHT